MISHFLTHGRGNIFTKSRGGGIGTKNGGHECTWHGVGISVRDTLESKCNGGGIVGIITNSVYIYQLQDER